MVTTTKLLKMTAGIVASGIFDGSLPAFAAKLVQMPFENGGRKLVRFPQKGEMILLRERPPLLETPFQNFRQGIFTPNDQFFVRWHLPVIPNSIDVDTFRLRVDGHVRTPTEFTLKEILHQPDQVELAAVNQCSGNSRGFSSPRVPGGEWGNGAMGNALWTGITSSRCSIARVCCPAPCKCAFAVSILVKLRKLPFS